MEYDYTHFHTQFYNLLTYAIVSDRLKLVDWCKLKWTESVYHSQLHVLTCYKIGFENKCVSRIIKIQLS